MRPFFCVAYLILLYSLVARMGRPPLESLGIPNLIFKTETEIMKDSNRLTRLKTRLSEVGKTTYIVRRAYAAPTP